MSDSSTSLSDLVQSIFSYNSNLLLAAIISLLLVVLFVLLLHSYANWFLPQSRRRSSVRISYILSPPAFDSGAPIPTKGLDSSAIAAIPLFVYESEKSAMECVICLSEFEEREIGRSLPECRHCFHIECIDMWLNSHSNCPICRAPAAMAESDRWQSEVRANGVEIVVDDQSSSSSATSSSSSSSSSSSPPPSSIDPSWISLKRILSRNKSEGRVFPSSNGIELNA